MNIIRWSKNKGQENASGQECLSEKVSLNRSTIWRLEQAGKFPRRIKLSDNAVGWDVDEVEQWLQNRKAVAK